MIDEQEEKEGGLLPGGTPGWVMPLVSMMTMLLAVCILLLSISRPDGARLAEVTASIRTAFGFEALSDASPRRADSGGGDSHAMVEAMAFEQAVELVRIKEKLAVLHQRLGDAKALEVKLVDEGFLIRLSRGAIFAEDAVTLRPEVEPLLKQLAQMIARLPNTVRIDSHAGEGRSAPLGSAWALTSAESATVADFFVKSGALDPARLRPMGHPAVREEGGAAPMARIEILLTRESPAESGVRSSGPSGAAAPAAVPASAPVAQ
ncbi:MAG: hypothetical protein HQL91_05215 [Magnetococcales bacterium]|nr:hypothetical protein [Magnetococcales bacterium]